MKFKRLKIFLFSILLTFLPARVGAETIDTEILDQPALVEEIEDTKDPGKALESSVPQEESKNSSEEELDKLKNSEETLEENKESSIESEKGSKDSVEETEKEEIKEVFEEEKESKLAASEENVETIESEKGSEDSAEETGKEEASEDSKDKALLKFEDEKFVRVNASGATNGSSTIGEEENTAPDAGRVPLLSDGVINISEEDYGPLLKIIKRAKDNGRPMKVAFKITNMETGESHILTTDDQGRLNEVYLENLLGPDKNHVEIIWADKVVNREEFEKAEVKEFNDPDKGKPKLENFEKVSSEEKSESGVNLNDKFIDETGSKKSYKFADFYKNNTVVFKANKGALLRVLIKYKKPSDKVSKATDSFEYDLDDVNKLDKQKLINELEKFALGRLKKVYGTYEENIGYRIETVLVKRTPARYKIEELRTDTNLNYNLEDFYIRVDESGAIYQGDTPDKINNLLVAGFIDRLENTRKKAKDLADRIEQLKEELDNIEKDNVIQAKDSNDSKYLVTISRKKGDPLQPKYYLDKPFKDNRTLREYIRLILDNNGDVYWLEKSRMFNTKYDESMTFENQQELKKYLDGLGGSFGDDDLHTQGKDKLPHRRFVSSSEGIVINIYRQSPCKVGEKTFKNAFEARKYIEEQEKSYILELMETENEYLQLAIPKEYSKEIKSELARLNKELMDLKKKSLDPNNTEDLSKEIKKKENEVNSFAIRNANKQRQIGKILELGVFNERFVFKTLASHPEKENEKVVEKGSDTKIKDKIIFDKLKVGSKYEFKGKLIHKASGQEVKTLNEIYYKIEKLAKADLGKSVDILVNFDSSRYQAGDEFVLIYEIYEDGILVGYEKDLENLDQTFKITEGQTPPPEDPPGENPPPEEPETPPKEELPPEKPETPPEEDQVVEEKEEEKPIIIKKQDPPTPMHISPKTYDKGIAVYIILGLLSSLALAFLKEKKKTANKFLILLAAIFLITFTAKPSYASEIIEEDKVEISVDLEEAKESIEEDTDLDKKEEKVEELEKTEAEIVEEKPAEEVAKTESEIRTIEKELDKETDKTETENNGKEVSEKTQTESSQDSVEERKEDLSKESSQAEKAVEDLVENLDGEKTSDQEDIKEDIQADDETMESKEIEPNSIEESKENSGLVELENSEDKEDDKLEISDPIVPQHLKVDSASSNNHKFEISKKDYGPLLKFIKLAEDGKTPMKVAFKLTNLTTGESHILVTDDEGRINEVYLENLLGTEKNHVEIMKIEDSPIEYFFNSPDKTYLSDRPDLMKSEASQRTTEEKVNQNDKFLDSESPDKLYKFDDFIQNDTVVFNNKKGYLDVVIEYFKRDGNSETIKDTDKTRYEIEDFDKFDHEGYASKLEFFAAKRLATVYDKQYEEGLFYRIKTSLVRNTPASYKLEELRTDTNLNYKLEDFYLTVDEIGSLRIAEEQGWSGNKIANNYHGKIKDREGYISSFRYWISNYEDKIKKVKENNLIELEGDGDYSYLLTITDMSKNKDPLDPRTYLEEDRPKYYLPIAKYDKAIRFANKEELKEFLSKISLGVKKGIDNYTVDETTYDNNGEKIYLHKSFVSENGNLALSFYLNRACKIRDQKFSSVFEAMSYIEKQQEYDRKKLLENQKWLYEIKYGESFPEKTFSDQTKQDLSEIIKEEEKLRQKKNLYILDLDYQDIFRQMAEDIRNGLGVGRPLDYIKKVGKYKVRKYESNPYLLGLPNTFIERERLYSSSDIEIWVYEQQHQVNYIDLLGKIGINHEEIRFNSYAELEKWFNENDMAKLYSRISDLENKREELAKSHIKEELVLDEYPEFEIKNEKIIFNTIVIHPEKEYEKSVEKGTKTRIRFTGDIRNLGDWSEYEIKGKLIHKKTKEEVKTDKDIYYKIENSKTASQLLDLVVAFDSRKYESGDEFVLVYEVYKDGVLAGYVRDLNNKDQSFKIIEKGKENPTPENPLGWNWDETGTGNIISDNGAIDISPLGKAKQNPDGSWTYKYRISFQPLISSDHIQSVRGLDITLPSFVQNVKFNLIGSWEEIEGEDGKTYLARRDVNIPLGIMDDTSEKAFLSEFYDEGGKLKDGYKLERKTIKDQYGNDRNLILVLDKEGTLNILELTGEDQWDFNAYKERYEQEYESEEESGWYRYPSSIDKYNDIKNKKILPNTITRLNSWTYGEYLSSGSYGGSYIIEYLEGPSKGKELFDLIGMSRVKKYSLASNTPRPIGIELSFTLTNDQVKKTPFVPVQAMAAWKCSQEGDGSGSYEEGCQSLYENRPKYFFNKDSGQLGSGKNSLMSQDTSNLLYNPELIKRDMFDINGLFGDTNISPTKYTGFWYKIGKDIRKGSFEYYKIYALRSNPSVTYVAPIGEDMADIAVVMPEGYGEYGDSLTDKSEQGQANDYDIDDAKELGYKDNFIDDANGGTDVSFISSSRNSDGSWRLSYRVTVRPIVFSEKIEENKIENRTANSFSLIVPKFVKNIRFRLLGTWENDPGYKDSLAGSTRVMRVNSEQKDLRSRNVNVELGIIDYNPDGKTNYKALPLYEDIAGKSEYKNVFVRVNNQAQFENLTGAKGDFEKLQAYGFTSAGLNPISFEVFFDVDEEQAKKTPYIPLDVRNNWVSKAALGEKKDPLFDHKDDVNLNDFRIFSILNKDGSLTDNELIYRADYPNNISKWTVKGGALAQGSHASHFRFIEFPELIKRTMFDQSGLHTEPGVNSTRASSSWQYIGKDSSAKKYESLYVPNAFYFESPKRNYWQFRGPLLKTEDLADIGVGYFYEPEIIPPEEKPEKPIEEGLDNEPYERPEYSIQTLESIAMTKLEKPIVKIEDSTIEDELKADSAENKFDKDINISEIKIESVSRKTPIHIAPKTYDPGIGLDMFMLLASGLGLKFLRKKNK